LVDFVIDTDRKNQFEGGLLVVAVLLAFLGSLRAALIVAAAIPLSLLFAFAGMYRFGIAASLLLPWPMKIIVDSILGAEAIPNWLPADRSAALLAVCVALVVIHFVRGALGAWIAVADACS
jgi:hypothetical protein